MDTSTYYIFEQAVANRSEATVTVEIADAKHTIKGQFLDRTDEGFWFHPQRLAAPLASRIVHSKSPVVFQIGAAGACATFIAAATKFDPTHTIDDAPTPAFYCLAPADVSLIQRRAHFRTPASPKVPLALTAWKIPPHWILRDRPKPSSQVRVELIDISNGGLCLAVLPNKTGPEQLNPGDRVRIDLRFEDAEAILDAELIYQHPPEEERPARAGLAFKKLDATIEGRRALFILDRAIAALQRVAIKQTTDAA
jgi:c-di-GMP-binding flagellar brake protein YcgR